MGVGWALPALAFGASLLGFALLALSQDRHWQLVTAAGEEDRAPGHAVVGVAIILQAVAGGLFILAGGASFGSLTWLLATTLAALGVALALTWAPACVRPLALLLRRLI